MVASLSPAGVINSALFPVICRYITPLLGSNWVIKGYKIVINSHNITADFRCYFSQDVTGPRFAKINLAKKALYSPRYPLAFCLGARDAERYRPFR